MIKNRTFLIRGAPDAPPGAPKASRTAYTRQYLISGSFNKIQFLGGGKFLALPHFHKLISDRAVIAVTFRRDRTGTHVSQRKVMVKRVHEEKKADMQKCMKKSSIAWGKAGPTRSTQKLAPRGASASLQGQRKGALVLPTMATESAVHILFCNKL